MFERASRPPIYAKLSSNFPLGTKRVESLIASHRPKCKPVYVEDSLLVLDLLESTNTCSCWGSHQFGALGSSRSCSHNNGLEDTKMAFTAVFRIIDQVRLFAGQLWVHAGKQHSSALAANKGKRRSLTRQLLFAVEPPGGRIQIQWE